jgi:hypothetical protein
MSFAGRDANKPCPAQRSSCMSGGGNAAARSDVGDARWRSLQSQYARREDGSVLVFEGCRNRLPGVMYGSVERLVACTTKCC